MTCLRLLLISILLYTLRPGVVLATDRKFSDLQQLMQVSGLLSESEATDGTREEQGARVLKALLALPPDAELMKSLTMSAPGSDVIHQPEYRAGFAEMGALMVRSSPTEVNWEPSDFGVLLDWHRDPKRAADIMKGIIASGFEAELKHLSPEQMKAVNGILPPAARSKFTKVVKPRARSKAKGR